MRGVFASEQYLYLVFSQTQTRMGKIIRFVTRGTYNHVALALQDSLRDLYSMGRFVINTPLAGGFVKESYRRYQNGGDCRIKVCRLPLKDYETVPQQLQALCKGEAQLLYNSFDALALPFGKRVSIPNAYTCLDFVCMLLGIKNVDSIGQLEALFSDSVIYEGSYDFYLDAHRVQDTDPLEEEFLTRASLHDQCKNTVLHFYHLARRMYG